MKVDEIVHQRGPFIAALTVALKGPAAVEDAAAALAHIKTAYGMDLDSYACTRTLSLLGAIIMCQSVDIDRIVRAIEAVLAAGADVNATALVMGFERHSAMWVATMYRECSEREQILRALERHGARPASREERNAIIYRLTSAMIALEGSGESFVAPAPAVGR